MKKIHRLIRMLLVNCLPVAFIVLYATFGANLVRAQAIEWEVKDPFRFVTYSKPGTGHWIMNEGETASQFVDRLMKTGMRENLPPFESTVYIRDNDKRKSGRYVEGHFFPTEIQVSAWIFPAPDGLCKWKYQSQYGDFNCNEKFQFNARTQFGEGAPILTVIFPDGRQTDPVEVLVRDRLVLGLGDSFASGQGNPDKPAEVDPVKVKELALKNRSGITNGRWMKNAKRNWLKSKADWLDVQCHRSLFSQHVLAAMRLVAEAPKESLTLLPLACSGAEVLDGLLIPQKQPPGSKRRVADSQVNAAVRHLCPSGKFTTDEKVFLRGQSGSKNLKRIKQKLLRCDGGVRKPDAVLLSVGGNDVGFAPAIAWAALPYSGRLGRLVTGGVEKVFAPVCPADTDGDRCGRVAPPAKYRIDNWLPQYYQYLMDELQDSGLVSDRKRIFLTAYPDPTYAKGGIEVCDLKASSDALEQIRTMLPWLAGPRNWDLWFTKDEVSELQANVISPLTIAMEKAANKHEWTFVSKYLEHIRRNHGLCSGYGRGTSACDSEESEPAPTYPHIRNGCWHPKSPDLEWAYDTERLRWFRNTNDSILFQYDGTVGSIKGSFHPDFRAHALMADEMFIAVSMDWQRRLGKE